MSTQRLRLRRLFVRPLSSPRRRDARHALAIALLLAVALLALPARPLPAQNAGVPSSVVVTVLGHEPLRLAAADLAALPRDSVTTVSNGISTTYAGVTLANVLKKAGAPLGSGMRGSALSSYVVAAAADGYQVVFSLGELDPDLSGGLFLLADSANGKPLFGENGAFRLVVPNDKRGARSIRMLSSLTVVQVAK